MSEEREPEFGSPPSALADIRVLDLSGAIGIYCTKLLADLGADVIMVEPPGGHPARHVGPFYHDQPQPEKSLSFFNLTTSKRSVTLDIHRDDGRELLCRLIATADIVVESFQPGFLDGVGLGYAGLQAMRPDIILTSVTGFGQTGRHSHWSWTDLVGVGVSGVQWLAGDQGDPPNVPYGQQGYASASIQAAVGTMMAVYYRDLHGEGQHVDVSMQEALSISQETAMQTYDMLQSIRSRVGGGRAGLSLTIPGIGPYPCKDGWVYGYLGTPGGAPWTVMYTWMEEEGMAEDLGEPQYREIIDNLNMRFLTELILGAMGQGAEAAEDKKARLLHIHEVLSRFFVSRGKWELYEGGQSRRLLIGIVSTPEDLVKNPQLTYRDFLQPVHHHALDDTLRYPGPPYRLSETPWAIRRRPPHIGEHNLEVYGELGLTEKELEALSGAGVI